MKYYLIFFNNKKNLIKFLYLFYIIIYIIISLLPILI